MAIVIGWSNRGRADKFTLEPKKNYTLGRSSKSNIQIPDNLFSSVHFNIKLNKHGEIEVKDLDSKNGVFINETKVLEENLYLQDELKVGATKFFIVTSELTENELKKLTYDGDAKKRLADTLNFKVEEVPYEPRGTRRTKDLIKEKYSLNSYSQSRESHRPVNYRKMIIYLLMLAGSITIFYYWFSTRYRIIV